jgi:hypothetical protein
MIVLRNRLEIDMDVRLLATASHGSDSRFRTGDRAVVG